MLPHILNQEFPPIASIDVYQNMPTLAAAGFFSSESPLAGLALAFSDFPVALSCDSFGWGSLRFLFCLESIAAPYTAQHHDTETTYDEDTPTVHKVREGSLSMDRRSSGCSQAEHIC